MRELLLHQLALFMETVDALRERVGKEYLQTHRYEIASVAILSSLELYQKVEVNSGRFHAALTVLAKHRNLELRDAQWAEPPELAEWAEVRKLGALVELSECLPQIRITKHDPRLPDIYGQVYRHVFDGAFAAILAGKKEVALPLFRAIFAEADFMRLRVVADLADRDATTQLIYAAEPVIGLLELSGYARLLEDLDGGGIWTEVKTDWDNTLADDIGGKRAGWLLDVAKSLDSVPRLTAGGLMRTRRLQQVEDLLAERGVVTPRRLLGIDEPASAASTNSRLVQVFADSTYGLSVDLADLFIAEYLRDRLPAEADLGRKVRSLIEQLSGEWRRRPSGRGRARSRAREAQQSEAGPSEVGQGEGTGEGHGA